MFFDWFKRNRNGSDSMIGNDQPHPTPTDVDGPGGGTRAAVAAPKPLDLPLELVARRAYEIWCRNGRPCDTQVPDWLTAEAELREELADGKLPQAMPPQ